MPQPLLSTGEYVEDEPVIDPFAERVGELEDRIASLESQLTNVKRDAVVALLTLLSDSMRHIAMGKMDIPDISSNTQGGNSKWDVVKQRLQPRQREAVDILLLQGSMKRTQLASAMKMDYANCAKNVVSVLKSAGWIVESGGNLSLKQL